MAHEIIQQNLGCCDLSNLGTEWIEWIEWFSSAGRTKLRQSSDSMLLGWTRECILSRLEDYFHGTTNASLPFMQVHIQLIFSQYRMYITKRQVAVGSLTIRRLDPVRWEENRAIIPISHSSRNATQTVPVALVSRTYAWKLSICSILGNGTEHYF